MHTKTPDYTFLSDIDMIIDNILDESDHRARVEDVMEEEERQFEQQPFAQFVQPYPPEYRAGKALQRGQTAFSKLKKKQKGEGKSIWEPFASREKWEVAQWLMENVGQTSTDTFLKIFFCKKSFVCSIMASYLTI